MTDEQYSYSNTLKNSRLISYNLTKLYPNFLVIAKMTRQIIQILLVIKLGSFENGQIFGVKTSKHKITAYLYTLVVIEVLTCLTIRLIGQKKK